MGSNGASEIGKLIEVVDRLLGPGGCPWDQEQTHESLKKHLLEEVYEVFDAIDSGDKDRLCNELGDLLLQPIMHAQMQARDGGFSIEDVASGITEKLIRRHPHVFGDVEVADANEVLQNWDRIKQSENSSKNPPSILDGVPKTLPSLHGAFEVSKRAARVGFEWPNQVEVFEKLDEELSELNQALASKDKEQIEAEIGDVLFTIVNIARWNEIEPEEAMRKMLGRFTSRFNQMEADAKKPLRELSAEEWDELWNTAKANERV